MGKKNKTKPTGPTTFWCAKVVLLYWIFWGYSGSGPARTCERYFSFIYWVTSHLSPHLRGSDVFSLTVPFPAQLRDQWDGREEDEGRGAGWGRWPVADAEAQTHRWGVNVSCFDPRWSGGHRLDFHLPKQAAQRFTGDWCRFWISTHIFGL